MISAIVSLIGGWRSVAFAALAAFALGAYGVAHYKLASANTATAEANSALQTRIAAEAQATADAQIVARTREYESALADAKVASDYQKAKHNVQVNADAVVSSLRAGTVRLQNRWNGCESARVSNAAAAAAERDATERGRQESAGRIIAAADACDAQVASLQALLIEDRAVAGSAR